MFEKYKKRLMMSNRSSIEATLENNRVIFDKNFTSSPSYYKVNIDGEPVDTIINKTRNPKEKLVNFRSGYEPRIGSVIEYQDKYHMLLTTDKDELFSFGVMEECNYFIPVQEEEATKELVGYDEFERPVYKEYKNFVDKPCIVKDTYYSASQNAQLPLPAGKLEILLQFQTMLNIDVNKEISLYEKTFKIADVSTIEVIDGVGYVRIHAERRDSSHE